MKEKPTVAVSRCLLGENVRYDGQTKAMPQLINQLAAEFSIVGVCPEVEIGLSVPRPAVQLVFFDDSVQAVGIEDAELNITQDLLSFADNFVSTNPIISGYVLKARSPSCGLGTTPIFPGGEVGSGLFAHRVQQQQKHVPMIDEIRLSAPLVLRQFVEAVKSYAKTNN